MNYKIKISDSTGLFEFRFLDSDSPMLYVGNSEIVWSNSLRYQARYTSNTVASTDTAYLYVYDKFDNLLKTITVNSETISAVSTMTISVTEIELQTRYQETLKFAEISGSVPTITFTNLENDILITNTRNNDFLFSVDNATWHADKLPISETGANGTKNLYIKRNKNTYGFANADIVFTNGTITQTLRIKSNLKSRLNDVWQTPALLNDWANYAGVQEVEFLKTRDDVVFIHGTVCSGTDYTIIQLPENYRPLNTLMFPADDDGVHATIIILATGDVKVGKLSNNIALSLNICFKI